MSDDVKQPHAERLLRQREAVAREFGLPADSWQVRRLALLMALYARKEDQAANGGDDDTSALLTLDANIQAAREAIRQLEPISIDVRFVPGTHTVCPSCQHEFNPHDGKPVRPYCPPPAPAAQEAPKSAAPPPAPKPAPTSNVVPIASGVSPMSFGGGYDPAPRRGGGLSPFSDRSPYRKDTSR